MGKSCSKENVDLEIDIMDTTLTEADYKTRLEQKLCMFKETPEPICDISECNLEKLPGNSLFSIIKVLRKEIVILGKNRLKSLASGGQLTELELVQVLDLSHNRFKVIPIEICVLKNLRVSRVMSRCVIIYSFHHCFLLIGTISLKQPVNTIALNNQSPQKTGAIGHFQQLHR